MYNIYKNIYNIYNISFQSAKSKNIRPKVGNFGHWYFQLLAEAYLQHLQWSFFCENG